MIKAAVLMLTPAPSSLWTAATSTGRPIYSCRIRDLSDFSMRL